ncbi:N-acetylmuramoyl-L-alanine amidase [Pararhizobium antarcticum]|uniref:N-acetylmuramoyl-L-alanine amidase n=1 Tax=Pararhizobium antarcticum TaxID=1798805 RepID=A0A657LSJ5_9HYPH|nr:N-acetylmuramoyl-L-alanine amidase [Pararhizobium antarcticum]OJF97316.1 N-acetylmuramoyl-L-alanine amidase [Pararhizobium antarcticum]OJG00331.1 N-acetylmuramoyl-L-alanine amidase [Rhizobium sp. 58]
MTLFACDYGPAACVPSPNHGERAGGRSPDMIILHYTGMETAESALDWLCRDESQVSCHYFVHEDGRVDQLVPETRRAWHAGRSIWKSETDINSASIGIEIVNAGHPGGLPDFPDAQIKAVIELCRDCGDRCSIAPERVLAHSDVAPIRKVDPGEKFPWNRLHGQGIGHWVEPTVIGGGRFFQRGDEGQPVQALQSMLSLYGYATEITGLFCEKTEGDVAAFQRHFRPARVDGIADMSTIDTLHRLLSMLPSFGA